MTLAGEIEGSLGSPGRETPTNYRLSAIYSRKMANTPPTLLLSSFHSHQKPTFHHGYIHFYSLFLTSWYVLICYHIIQFVTIFYNCSLRNILSFVIVFRVSSFPS